VISGTELWLNVASVHILDITCIVLSLADFSAGQIWQADFWPNKIQRLNQLMVVFWDSTRSNHDICHPLYYNHTFSHAQSQTCRPSIKADAVFSQSWCRNLTTGRLTVRFTLTEMEISVNGKILIPLTETKTKKWNGKIRNGNWQIWICPFSLYFRFTSCNLTR